MSINVPVVTDASQPHALECQETTIWSIGDILPLVLSRYCDREAGFAPLTFHTKRLAFECGLVQPCTDIIRFSHGASSSRKVYRSSFIPGLHDVCMIFEKPSGGRVSV